MLPTDQIAKYMALANDDCIFMEGNPGLGLLTKLALDAGVQRLRVFEGNPVFLPRLQVRPKVWFVFALVSKELGGGSRRMGARLGVGCVSIRWVP